jgi:hypothetical protein
VAGYDKNNKDLQQRDRQAAEKSCRSSVEESQERIEYPLREAAKEPQAKLFEEHRKPGRKRFKSKSLIA